MSTYFDEAALKQTSRAYPIGEAFSAWACCVSSDELWALKNRRFQRAVARAFEIPFYQRLWGEQGIEPGDIRDLSDLTRLPVFSKSDLMTSLERVPPWGDYHGMDRPAGQRYRAVVQTTSGTTGHPQALFFGAKDREIQNRLLARAYLLQGLNAGDVVHSVYGFGMVNGGHYVREALLHYTDALLLPAGTGLETPSATQVALMRLYGASVLVGFGDYLAQLARVAKEQGMVPGRDLHIRLISGHIAHQARQSLSDAWGGARVVDWYGVGDTGIVAAESTPGTGLHVWEDAHQVEILDPDTQAAVADGTLGNVCVTTLYKDTVYPIIRFNTNDLSARLPEPCDRFPAFGRVLGFRGRSDDMVKLRGINVYPASVAACLAEHCDATGEYVCRVFEQAGRVEMQVLVEWQSAPAPGARENVARALREAVGVSLQVELVAPGATALLTGIESRQKPRRLIDER